ncbi:carboxypeptidase-like protein S1 [Calycina marina]|uniref:Carboxypeptidase-like protein S1 n=1 Tax=Calycina marina TaxID=1763456 RepID=A0A9P8CHV2_9HELO|nr:carboxypeptidase-like protein S1 [Calycina marina]
MCDIKNFWVLGFFVTYHLFVRRLLGAVGATPGFPPTPKGATTFKSKYHEEITIAYKETTPGVKRYSGYVHLPPGLSSNVFGAEQFSPLNTSYQSQTQIFLVFEARKDPHNAPLSIWLDGGPGSSLMYGLLTENGPCFIGTDSNSTYLNPWSWNNEVNMLYIDQPTQTGFPYDFPINITANIELSAVGRRTSCPSSRLRLPMACPRQTTHYSKGTTGSQFSNGTKNTTQYAAHAIWNFSQIWFSDIVNLWTESYRGHYDL